MNKRRGVFIALYGPDGTGKSRQMSLLEEKLRENRIMCRAFRYPVYEIEPTGKKLDELLHIKRTRLPEEEMQRLFAQNRMDFEPTLRAWLESGMTVVAENYKGTGLVWGSIRGISLDEMETMNKDVIEPDLSIFLDGPKRTEMIEGHPYGMNEGDDEWYQVRNKYWELSDKYGWVRISGDAPMLTVANRIWAVVKPVVEMR